MYDVKAQKLVADQLNVLSNLAELVVRQLEKDHLLKLQKLVRAGSWWASLAYTRISETVHRPHLGRPPLSHQRRW